MGGKEKNIPNWSSNAPEKKSYRSIFKWGDPEGFKHPNNKLVKMMKEKFNMTDNDFEEKINEGRSEVKLENKPVLLSKEAVSRISEIVGEENISVSDYDRLKFSTGKTVEEIFELRQNKIAEVTDLVVHPRSKKEIQEIVDYCNNKLIPIYVYSGGSSVNLGYRPVKGGITLVMSTHLNKIININKENKTCTVQAGIMGPELEKGLNKDGYTNGHFPQSFEYSTVGGWIVTLGSGQQSSYFGDAGDLVIDMEWITPAGSFKTKNYPASATGPKVNDIMKGSEGVFGVLVEVTIKLFYYMPENNFAFSYIFKSWDQGIAACREISQGEFGFPGVMRISDPEETDMGLKLYGVDDTILDTFMKIRGYKPMKRCLFLGRTEGERGFAKNVRKKAKKICRKYGGMSLTSYPLKSWEHGRYKDPYLREDMNDFGIMIDTMEAGISWDNLMNLHKGVRAFVKSRPDTMCYTHASHFYPEGTNLYFIINCKLNDLNEYRKFQRGIIDSINKLGGSLSHHHGVGRMIAPWMEEHLGKEQMDVLRALKKHFDPNNIMNPGGQLGLDYNASDLKNHNWRINWKLTDLNHIRPIK